MDDELRNRLWTALQLTVWDRWTSPYQYGYQDPDSQKVEFLLKLFWIHHFKFPLDTLPSYYHRDSRSGYGVLRENFFSGKWWEAYDFIEFILKSVAPDWQQQIKESVNSFLEAENAAYRIVDEEIVEITDIHEIEAIESAIEKGTTSVRVHLQRSLDMLSDRKNPDLRNSIKEAISAVEAACQTVSGKRKATLTDCLKALRDRKPLHAAFEQALVRLYGYTSDEGGYVMLFQTNRRLQPTLMLSSC